MYNIKIRADGEKTLMDAFTLVLTALALSMDAFAVSVSNGMCYPKMSGGQRITAAAAFGIFQGIMPIAGFFGGVMLGGVIRSIDHWVALALLGAIGGKMAVEGIRSFRAQEKDANLPEYTFKTMLVQSFATSIDALAVGISFAAFSVNIWAASGIIAAITFTVCLAGALAGKLAGGFLGRWAQVLGGLVLVGIGVKIFLEHTV